MTSKKGVTKRAASKSLRTAKAKGKRGTNPNSLANLEAHKFPPGVSGNPGGRPKLLSDAFKEWLASINESDPYGRTNAQIGAAAIGGEMLGGNVAAAQAIARVTEGDTLNLEGAVMVSIDR